MNTTNMNAKHSDLIHIHPLSSISVEKMQVHAKKFKEASYLEDDAYKTLSHIPVLEAKQNRFESTSWMLLKSL